MNKKQWENLRVGDVIYNKLDGYNTIVSYDNVLYLMTSNENGIITGHDMFNLDMFNHKDWKLILK